MVYENKELTAYLSDLYEEARRSKAPYMDKWWVFRQAVAGNQWEKKARPKSFVGVLNYCRPTAIGSYANLLTGDLILKIIPRRGLFPDAAIRADYMNLFLHGELDTINWKRQKSFGSWDIQYTGNAFYKVIFDPRQIVPLAEPIYDPDTKRMITSFPLGRLQIKAIPPEMIYVDPYATREGLSTASYVIERHMFRLSTIIRMFDIRDEKIIRLLKTLAGWRMSDNAPFWESYTSPPTTQVPYRFGSGMRKVYPGTAEDKLLTVYEIYFKDENEIKYDINVVLKDKYKKLKGTSKKYPHGRRILWIDKLILLDEPNAYAYDEIPNVAYPYPYVHHIYLPNELPNVFWGTGLIEQALPVNLDINYIYSRIIKQLALMANPGIWAELGAIKQYTKFTNEDGGITLFPDGALTTGKIQRLEGLGVDASALNILFVLQKIMEIMTGRTEVTEGRRPKGVSTATGLIALQQAANIRMLPIYEACDRAYEQVGHMAIYNFGEFYAKSGIPRLLTLQKDRELVELAIKFFEEDKYAWTVNVSSMEKKTLTPEERNWLTTLFSMGAIDRKKLLERSGIDGVSEMLQELEERERQQAMMQQQLLEQQSASQAKQSILANEQAHMHRMREKALEQQGKERLESMKSKVQRKFKEEEV